MTITLTKLLASAKVRRFPDEASADRFLDAQDCRDPETRIAFKHSLAAQGELATDRHVQPGAMATDTDHPAAPATYVDRLLDRASIQPRRTYAERDIDRLLREAGIEELDSRIAIKTTLAQRGQLR
jgi:hypothetical protein